MIGYRRLLLLLALLWAPGFGVLASADELNVTTRIDSVTLFPDDAKITRLGQISGGAGEHVVVVNGLPSGLNEDSLRFSLSDANINITGLQIQEVSATDYNMEAERKLRAELHALQDQAAVIDDAMATASLKLKLLDNLAAKPTDGRDTPALNPVQLVQLLEAMGKSADAARARIQAKIQEKREIDVKISQKNHELNQFKGGGRTSMTIRAGIIAAKPFNVTLRLDYLMGDAGWNFGYEANLDTEAASLVLARQAVVEQETGEDWHNVRLRLTNASVSSRIDGPEAMPVYLTLWNDDLAKVSSDRLSEAQSAALIEEVVVTGSRVRQAATDYSIAYDLPGRYSIGSGQASRHFPMGEQAWPVKLVTRAYPAEDRSAYLLASFQYEGDSLFAPGSVSLYRDHAFVGATELEAAAPGEDVEMPFGADDLIEISYIDDGGQRKEHGLFSKRAIMPIMKRIEVANDPVNMVDPDGRESRVVDDRIEITPKDTSVPAVSIPNTVGAKGVSESSMNFHDYDVSTDTSGSGLTAGDAGRGFQNNPTPGSDQPASANGTVNNAGPIPGSGNENLVGSFTVPSPDPSSFTDVTVNYTIAGEHGLNEGFVVRFGEIGPDGSVSALRSYGEGNAWQQNEALGGIWGPQVERVWQRNHTEIIHAAPSTR